MKGVRRREKNQMIGFRDVLKDYSLYDQLIMEARVTFLHFQIEELEDMKQKFACTECMANNEWIDLFPHAKGGEWVC